MLRLLFIHAHYDDFEFAAAGTFMIWKQKLGDALKIKVIVCTDGKAGHHFRTREETGQIRLQEQLASARIGDYQFENLRLPDGQIPRETRLDQTPDLLPALWKAIRDFEPDYLFCPPIPSDPLAGVHLDHMAIAVAVRNVAYLINVPHAFTPEYPADETKSAYLKTPVIVNVYDSYMKGANAFDFVIDVEKAFQIVCEMSYCHQSQITEWLPWVGRHHMAAPKSIDDWRQTLRARCCRRNRELGLPSERAAEVFTVTAWGELPDFDQLLQDFPSLTPSASNLARLKERLARWKGSQ
jgi:LmbE family N-acetylglucosaminyl deacetylase